MPYTAINDGELGADVRAKINGQFQEVYGFFPAPVTLTTSTSITQASHSGRTLRVNSATAVTLTLPTTANDDVVFRGINLGAGAVSFAISGGGTIQADAILPATAGQFSAFEIRRVPGAWIRVA